MIPLGDRQTAMSLLLELALQRGTLSHILDALLLLLRLSDMPSFAGDKNRRLHKSVAEEEKEDLGGEGGGGRRRGEEGSATSFPLVPFLRRIGSIPTPPSLYTTRKGQEVTKRGGRKGERGEGEKGPFFLI